jgi:uncharacterized membrane protein
MIQRFVRLSLAVISVAALQGCYYDVEEELFPPSSNGCDTTSVGFAAKVKPILDAQCASCHGGANPDAGINLSTYDGTKVYLDADKAVFISSIVQDGNASNMPKSQPKMSDCNINTIKAWVNSGYPNN